MTGNELVSVIVPIYNVEGVLHDCLDSVVNQTYKNLEIILVDDRSPDESGKIADNYARRDSRVKVIHKPKNEGLNMARATGFSASTGMYVMFVDSDDAIARDAVEFALRAILKNKVDFAKFNLLTFSDRKDLPEGLSSIDELGEEKIISGKKDLYKSRFNNELVGISRVTVWGGLYLTDAVRRIDWSNSNYRQHEDVYWTMQFIENIDKGVFLSRIGYFYRVNESDDSVLSKQLTGNTLNGKPIGFLEFAHDYSKKLNEYNKKYDLELDDEVDRFVTWQWIDRLSKISKTELFTAENNLKYLSTAINAVLDKYKEIKDQVHKQDHIISGLREDNKVLSGERDALFNEVNKLRDKHTALKNELQSHMSIKRSSRLLLGNIKRKIRSIIG